MMKHHLKKVLFVRVPQSVHMEHVDLCIHEHFIRGERMETTWGDFIVTLHPVHLGSDAQKGRPIPPNMTIQAWSDLPRTLPRRSKHLSPPETRGVWSASDIRLFESNCSLRKYLTIFAHSRFHTRIHESLNLFEIMIENGYSFRKHSFVTIDWFKSDSGSGVRGIHLEYKNGPRILGQASGPIPGRPDAK